MYLLDTNVCIKYLNGQSLSIKRKIESLFPEDIIICSVVRSELFYGAFKSQNPVKTLEKQRLFLSVFKSIPFDDNVAEIYGSIRAQLAKKGELIGPYDLQIAAIALCYQLTLVTHNTGEFGRVKNLLIEDWEQ